MASKATSERQRGLHKALLIAASLAIVLAAGPVLAQEEEVVAPAGATAELEATPAVVTDEAPGDGYQEGGLGGVLAPLEVIPAEPAPGQQPDPGQPPGVTPENPDASQEGQSPDDPTGDQNPAQQAARAAGQAAQEARLAASDAEEAAQSTVQQSSASPEDVEFAQQAAQEARLAASDAEEAAEHAQQAAAQEDAPAAQEAAREAQRATQEAQQASGAVQQVAQQAAQQVVDDFGGPDEVKEAYTRAVQAAWSAADKGDSAAFAAESNSNKGPKQTPRKPLLAAARRPRAKPLPRKPLAAKGAARTLPASRSRRRRRRVRERHRGNYGVCAGWLSTLAWRGRNPRGRRSRRCPQAHLVLEISSSIAIRRGGLLRPPGSESRTLGSTGRDDRNPRPAGRRP